MIPLNNTSKEFYKFADKCYVNNANDEVGCNDWIDHNFEVLQEAFRIKQELDFQLTKLDKVK